MLGKQQIRILVAEDDPSVRHTVSTMLNDSSPGFTRDEIVFSKSFQRCGKVVPLQRSTASAKCRNAPRILVLCSVTGHHMAKGIAKVAAARRFVCTTFLDAAHEHSLSGDRDRKQ